MEMDDKGFVRATVDIDACVDCKQCVNVCPQINYKNQNIDNPHCYALKADDVTVRSSSSGGVFSLLADWISSRGGYVSGVVYDGDMNAVFITARDHGVVESMHGSKYVYSEMGDVYAEVHSLLKGGREVLFVGLPCQVQALKNYLNEVAGSTDGLYAVDLLCGGLPSKGVFRKYLDELSKEKKVVNVSFRGGDLPYGTLAIDYQDGTKKIINGDPYFRCFHRSVTINQACSNCLFSNTPKPGDLTIGDLWSANRLLTDVDLSQGMSVVLVNTEKGMEVFDQILKSAAYCKEIPLSFSKRFNRYGPKPMSPDCERFYHLLSRGHTVSKATFYALEHFYDVGIIGFWRVKNYGGTLSYYALYHLLEDMGLETVFLDSRHQDLKGRLPNPSLLKSGYPSYSRDVWYPNREQMYTNVNPRIRNFIVGPDQVWNRKLINQNALECYALDFVAPYRNSISVASSVDASGFKGTKEEEKRFSDLLGKINHVSVLDAFDKKYCERIGVEPELIPDPILLCDPSHFAELASKGSAAFPPKFVFNYMMNPKHFIGTGAVYRRLKTEPVCILGATAASTPELDYPQINIGSVENWLNALIGSSFVFTDSFHAAAVAILFRKPFVVLAPFEKGAGGRITDMLKSLGLEGRLFTSIPDLLGSGVLDEQIDFDAAHEKLAEMREKGLGWIRNALV